MFKSTLWTNHLKVTVQNASRKVNGKEGEKREFVRSRFAFYFYFFIIIHIFISFVFGVESVCNHVENKLRWLTCRCRGEKHLIFLKEAGVAR